MSRRRRQGLSPSLFPFLAVLVCTLGTLILLLALVAENATAAAEQNARAQQRAEDRHAVAAANSTRMTSASVEALLREEEFRVTELVSVRDQQTAELGTKRDELTHVDDHIERLRKQLQQLNDEVLEATGEVEAPEISDTTIAEIRERIDAERTRLEKLREEAADQSPRVVIVPHKGPNGTDRRPVYLECDAEGITIWPEGSHISMEQLENASYSANPLDAALRTIRMHVMQNYGDSVPPYPLLVVRPDGIESYGAARMAMRDWDDQFGYELVPEEVKLAFTKPDANLKRRIEIAINTAAAEQRVRMAMAQRSLGSRGALGNSVRGGSDSARTNLPVLSAAALDRAGRASGFGQLRDDPRGRASSSVAGVPYERSPYTQGREIGSASIGSVPPTGYAGQTSEINDAGAAARRMAEQMQSAAQEMRTGGAKAGVQGIGEAGSSQPASIRSPLGKHYADLSPGGEAEDANGASDGGAPQSGPTENKGPSSVDGTSPGPEESLTQDASALDWDSSSIDGGSGAAGALSRESSSPTAGTNQSSSQANGAPASSDLGASQQSQLMQPPPTTQGAPPMQGSPSVMGSPLTMTDQQLAADPRLAAQMPPGPQPSMRPSMRPSTTSGEELVRRQGRDWALPDSMAGMHGNAIVRTIRVQCYPDRFVLLPAKSEGPTEVFGFFNGDIERASLELATALRDRIERWGPALPGGRWQPRLEVQITPRSEMRFHQLRTLMNGSGIELIGKESP